MLRRFRQIRRRYWGRIAATRRKDLTPWFPKPNFDVNLPRLDTVAEFLYML